MGHAEVQKMTEMKKAYANIILHTAAARIMVSERKAFRFQKGGADAKEEALGMLLRLKQMMDSKMHEAEVLSFGQKKRIKELAGQLQEAKNIVGDLREELAVVQNKLERAKKRERSQSPNEKLSNHHGYGIEYAETSNNTKSDASESVLDSCSNSKLGPQLTSDGKLPTLVQRKDESQFQKTGDSASMTHFGSAPYLPSILKRTKVPLTYSSGFSHGIHSLKGNKLGGTFCSSDEITHSKKNLIVESLMFPLPTENKYSNSGGKKAQEEKLIIIDAGFNLNLPEKPVAGEQRRHVEYVNSNAPLYEHLPTWDLARHENTGHCSSKIALYGSSPSEENSVNSKREVQKAMELLLTTKTCNLKTSRLKRTEALWLKLVVSRIQQVMTKRRLMFSLEREMELCNLY